MRRFKERLKAAWQWARREVLNKGMLCYLLIAEAVFWSPCIVGVVLAVTVNSWWWTVPTVYAAFWAGPFTPAIPIQLGMAYGLKKLVQFIRRRKK